MATSSSAASADDARVLFLIKLGRALHETGFPAPHLEAALGRVAKRLELPAQFFSTPTSLFCAFGEGTAQRTHLERVEPRSAESLERSR